MPKPIASFRKAKTQQLLIVHCSLLIVVGLIQMQIIVKLQDELYGLALRFTGDSEKSKKAVIKAFNKILKSYHCDSSETRVELYKNLFNNIGFFSICKKSLDKAGFINIAKHSLSVFDKKVFVLKYEADFTVNEISYILRSSSEKIKKSLLKSTERVSDALKDLENEM